MTFVQFVAALLEEDWETSVSGRSTDVPKPTIVKEKDVSREDLRQQDVARVVDGGDTTFEPRGFGWTHERIDADVTIELRTSERRNSSGILQDGRHRLFGKRDSTAETDPHVGLVGETLRVLKNRRKGYKEYDLIVHGPAKDESDAEGTNYYRADIDVALIQHASQIDASP